MKHIQAWVLWVVVFFCIRLPLMAIGVVFFPLMYVTRKRDDSLRKIFWLWDNEEDGIYGAPFWIKRNDGKYNFKTAYTWSALRNPVNNMRFTKLGLNRDKIIDIEYKYWGDPEIPTPHLARNRKGRKMWHYSLVRRGWLWYPSFWYINATKSNVKHFRVRAGWKCTYKWIQDNDLSQSGKYSGATFQFLPNRNG